MGRAERTKRWERIAPRAGIGEVLDRASLARGARLVSLRLIIFSLNFSTDIILVNFTNLPKQFVRCVHSCVQPCVHSCQGCFYEYGASMVHLWCIYGAFRARATALVHLVHTPCSPHLRS